MNARLEKILARQMGKILFRLEVMPGTDDRQVLESIARCLGKYLAAQGLSSTGIEKANEPPMRDQVSGKFRQVWADSSLGSL